MLNPQIGRIVGPSFLPLACSSRDAIATSPVASQDGGNVSAIPKVKVSGEDVKKEKIPAVDKALSHKEKLSRTSIATGPSASKSEHRAKKSPTKEDVHQDGDDGNR